MLLRCAAYSWLPLTEFYNKDESLGGVCWPAFKKRSKEIESKILVIYGLENPTASIKQGTKRVDKSPIFLFKGWRGALGKR